MPRPRSAVPQSKLEDSGKDRGGGRGASAPRQDKTTVTMQLPSKLDKNVNAFCAVIGLTKTEYVAKTIEKDLRSRGLNPDDEPKLLNLEVTEF